RSASPLLSWDGQPVTRANAGFAYRICGPGGSNEANVTRMASVDCATAASSRWSRSVAARPDVVGIALSSTKRSAPGAAMMPPPVRTWSHSVSRGCFHGGETGLRRAAVVAGQGVRAHRRGLRVGGPGEMDVV